MPPDWLDQAPVTRGAARAQRRRLRRSSSCCRAALTTSPAASLLQLGASYALATIGEGRWETLVTACFLHGSVLHVGFNMLALWQAGPWSSARWARRAWRRCTWSPASFGNLLSVAYGWLARGHAFGSFSVGASGAISGVIAAALVVGWRMQGWRGPLTQAMARWLGFVVVFGLLSNLSGGSIDNAAHIGGAIAGGAIAGRLDARHRYSDVGHARGPRRVRRGLVAACIAVLSVREATNPFASMIVQERQQFTMAPSPTADAATRTTACSSVERLRGPIDSLRKQVEMTCGHVNER